MVGCYRTTGSRSSSTRSRLCRYGVPCLILLMITGLVLFLVFQPKSKYDLPELYTIPSWRVSKYGDQLIMELQTSMEKIGSNPEPATFENTIQPLDAIFYKFWTAVYSCYAHATGASDKERAVLLNLLCNPASLRNSKLYQRVQSVLETLPEGNEDYRFAKACEMDLRSKGSSLNATSVERFDRLHDQIRATSLELLFAPSPETMDDPMRRLISHRSESVQLISPHDDWASYEIAESCAGSIEEVESLLTETVQLHNSIGLTRFRQELGAGSGNNRIGWKQYVDEVMTRLSMLHNARWKLEDVLSKGIFFVAKKLYGLDVVERFDVPKHHSGVRVFEFLEEDGTKLGLVFMDLKRRMSKKADASALRLMERSLHLKLDRSAAIMMMNIPENTDQINFYEVWTLFHEFGHCLHILFSNPKYTLLSAMHAPLDWLEFPSQLNEMWAHDPEVLRNVDPSLTDEQISQIQNEFAFADALKKFLDLLTGIAGYHWGHLTQPPTDLLAFIRQLQERYGIQFISDLENFLSPKILLHPKAPLVYAYTFSWRTARSAQDWMKANGGLCRKTGDQIRQETLSKGWSVPYEDMINLFQQGGGYQNVTLHEDLTHLPIHLANQKPSISRHIFSESPGLLF